MSDAGRTRFEGRLARIDEIHAHGGAFEANGALGRSYFDARRPKERSKFPWRGVALVLAGTLLFKAAILANIGQEAYDRRVTALVQGNMAEQVGGWILQADAPTQWIAAKLHGLVF